MILAIVSKDNRGFAQKYLKDAGETVFVSPKHQRAVHGAQKVVVFGDYPGVIKRYRGIAPVEIINPGEDTNESDLRDTDAGK